MFLAIIVVTYVLFVVVAWCGFLVWKKYRCPQCGGWASRVERDSKQSWVGWYHKMSGFPQYYNSKKRICEHCDHLINEQTWFSDFPTDQEAYTVFMGRVLKKDPANPVTLEEDRH